MREAASGVRGFAASVEDGVAHERRWDLLREARYSLRAWDLHRRREDAERCYLALRTLAELVKGAAPAVDVRTRDELARDNEVLRERILAEQRSRIAAWEEVERLRQELEHASTVPV